MTRRIILDTDTAADDSFAMLVALLHPEAQLEAVTVVAGNVNFDQQLQNALLTIRAAGREHDIQVHPGARAPLVREWVPAKAHGDGKGNHDFPPLDQQPSDEVAVDALLRLVNANPGAIDIVAIGPLTNLALAVQHDPGFAGNVRSLWIMGGCDNAVGNITAAAEYNFYVDPDAAKNVIDAGFDITLVTWTLTLAQATWTRHKLDEIAALGTPLAEFFTILDTPNVAFNATVGIEGSTHPDMMTILLLLQPDLIQRSSRAYLAVEATSDLTRGYSMIDRRHSRNRPNATIIDQVNADGVYRAFATLLASRQ